MKSRSVCRLKAHIWGGMVGPGPEPKYIADRMSVAWIVFARSGNPNTEALPSWPAYDLVDRAPMIFNVESKVENDPYGRIRRTLER